VGATDPKPPGRYVKGVKPVSFRPSRAQRDALEADAARLAVTVSEATRRRCFPEDAQPEELDLGTNPED
jgi:hypothetical protein